MLIHHIETFTSIMLLKSAFEKNMDFLVKVIDFMQKTDFIDIERVNENNHLIIVLEYISQTRDITLEELNVIIHQTGIEGEKIMPTLAQKLEKQGHEKGMQQGMLKGMHKKAVATAESLLTKGMSISEIAEITGLSRDEVEKLRRI